MNPWRVFVWVAWLLLAVSLVLMAAQEPVGDATVTTEENDG